VFVDGVSFVWYSTVYEDVKTFSLGMSMAGLSCSSLDDQALLKTLWRMSSEVERIIYILGGALSLQLSELKSNYNTC